MAGSTPVLLDGIHMLDDRRAVCLLSTLDGRRLTGIYAADDGHISAACHYFSDLDTLIHVGILGEEAPPGAKPHIPPAPIPVPPARSDGDAVPALADELSATRLEDRQERLLLVLCALEEPYTPPATPTGTETKRSLRHSSPQSPASRRSSPNPPGTARTRQYDERHDIRPRIHRQ